MGLVLGCCWDRCRTYVEYVPFRPARGTTARRRIVRYAQGGSEHDVGAFGTQGGGLVLLGLFLFYLPCNSRLRPGPPSPACIHFSVSAQRSTRAPPPPASLRTSALDAMVV